MATDFEFRTPPQIVCAAGACRNIPDIIRSQYDRRRALIVTDAGVIGAGLVEPLVVALKKADVSVTIFGDIIADPPESTIHAVLDHARAANADIIIGFGGGSSMDAAKLVAVLLDSHQSLADIYGVGNVRGSRSTPLILVPTTAGTGSEVTPISIVTTGETTKMGVVSPQLYADIAILDAALTIGLPAHITAATGIDAMVHAIEAYTSRLKKNPISDMLARAALHALSANIIAAVQDANNLEARTQMLLGAMWAGQAFANAPVGAVHALAYPIGGIFHVPHGLSNALVLPHVLRFNACHAAPLYAQLAKVIDPVARGSDAALTDQLIEKLETIAQAVGIERRLRDVGIAEHDIDTLAQAAMLQTRLLVNNPRDVKLVDAVAMYRDAY